eukprot:CAMPEP_0201507084 /NCGR_PEP_ID=MMETSP0161_2-20130828/864_1 /ASSEMBLY_ACC=CAM_ASM_000251 /TAXON_ID=180227 /ORGANISM="Neoparamoeba aestuarina, Strain SoJaBio B1-5/56/2" /LENGTH=112 /DNA_ID=CAMNT_0047901359 /DNA_START=372 /DNA_END=710 /DNA_ORIENTATION=+
MLGQRKTAPAVKNVEELIVQIVRINYQDVATAQPNSVDLVIIFVIVRIVVMLFVPNVALTWVAMMILIVGIVDQGVLYVVYQIRDSANVACVVTTVIFNVLGFVMTIDIANE